MKNSWIYHDQENTVVQGMDRSGIKVKPYVFNSFLSSEGMRASCSDLANFAQNLLQNKSSLLASEKSKRYTYAKDIEFQYPWFKLKVQKSKDIYSYAGRTEGHNAQIFLYPETKTGVILLANGSQGVPYLALNILRMMNKQWKRKPISDIKN